MLLLMSLYIFPQLLIAKDNNNKKKANSQHLPEWTGFHFNKLDRLKDVLQKKKSKLTKEDV